jgi:hypothetical protein
LLTLKGGAKPGLPSRLRRHVLLALALSWGLGSLLVVTVGQHFAAQAFDRALLDDAYALAAHVRVEAGTLRLDLTPHELSAMLFDQSETVYFAVFAPAAALSPAIGGCRRRRSRRPPLTHSPNRTSKAGRCTA